MSIIPVTDDQLKEQLYNSYLEQIRKELDPLQDLVEVYKKVLDKLAKMPDICRAAIYFYNSIRGEYQLGYICGTGITVKDLTEPKVILEKESVFKSTSLNDRVVIINDVEKAERYFPSSCNAKSELLVLLVREEIIGQLICTSEKENAFTEIDKKFILEIAETVTEKFYSI